MSLVGIAGSWWSDCTLFLRIAVWVVVLCGWRDDVGSRPHLMLFCNLHLKLPQPS